MNEIIPKISGLTKQEIKVMGKICEALSEWIKLEKQHPNETQDFVNAIHSIQYLLAMRVIRRGYPKYWITHRIVEPKPEPIIEYDFKDAFKAMKEGKSVKSALTGKKFNYLYNLDNNTTNEEIDGKWVVID
jgi:hypothetical protein